MRIVILYILLFCLAIYAWRDWFIALCGLIVLSAFVGHPDMPSMIMGIHGLNPWNAMLLAVVIPWLVRRRQEGAFLQAPVWLGRAFVGYVFVVVYSYVGGVIDVDSLPPEMRESQFTFTVEYLLNPLKILVPPLLLYSGCRSRRRVLLGLFASLAMVAFCSVLIVRTTSISGLKQTERAEMRQRRRIGKRLGFHANRGALVCAVGFWAALATMRLRKRGLYVPVGLALALLMALALVLTRSRAGYLAFFGVGVIFSVFIWRFLLVVWPAVVCFVWIVFPGVPQRLTAGFGLIDPAGEETYDEEAVTAGRTTVLWPPVIEEIARSPILGSGRLAMSRTRAYQGIIERGGMPPTHPHNAYLQLLIDTGVLGFVPTMLFYGLVFRASVRLCSERRRDPIYRVVGIASLGAVLTLMIMGMSGQSFYPGTSLLASLCFHAMALRLWSDLCGTRSMQGAQPTPQSVNGR